MVFNYIFIDFWKKGRFDNYVFIHRHFRIKQFLTHVVSLSLKTALESTTTTYHKTFNAIKTSR